MWLCVLTGDPEMSAEQVVALRFGITSALSSAPQRCIWAPRWRVGVGTGDPKMSAEQVVALRFGIKSALASTTQRCIWAPGWKVGVGTADSEMNAEQVVVFRFGALPTSNAVFGFLLGEGLVWALVIPKWVRFGITSALPSTPPMLYLGSSVKGGEGTGDPKMSAEQVVALRFGINAVFGLLGEGLVWALVIPKWVLNR